MLAIEITGFLLCETAIICALAILWILADDLFERLAANAEAKRIRAEYKRIARRRRGR